MSLRFYMDVHVPVVITQQLRRRGIDVLTSQEDGTRRASDDDQFIEDLELIASCSLKEELASQVIFLPLS